MIQPGAGPPDGRRIGESLRRVLRYGAAIFAALAVLTLYEAWGVRTGDVLVVYDAPPGELAVTLSEARPDAPVLRRTVFAAGTQRSHEVRLSEGPLQAVMRVGGETSTRDVTVRHGQTLEIRWR